MQPEEYDYYSERLTRDEKLEYFQICQAHGPKRINDDLFNFANDIFWKRVKERVDKVEGKIK